MLSIGIDSGSSTTKGVLFDGQQIVATHIVATGANPKRTMESLYDHFKAMADSKGLPIYTVTTGYGRDLLQTADKKVTEITCHGIGASYLVPNTRAVIDIGGQDSKVIVLDKDTNIKDFLMNDKCAAGTGRFVEVIMRLLHQDLDDLDMYVANTTPVKISSMCTVFAESEVIGLLAQDTSGNAIASGVIDSICNRTATFAKRLPIEDKVFFSGGLAQFEVMQKGLSKHLGQEVVFHELSQYAGAIGAAIIGHRKTHQ